MKSLMLILLVSCMGMNEATIPVWYEPGKNSYALTLEEAKRILGEAVKVQEDKDSTAARGYFRKTNVYTAELPDPKTNKVGNLYYMYENFPDESAPKKLYETWRKGNQDHQGFESLSDLGDEAFFQTDRTNFVTLIVRRGNKLIRLKINKLTSKTSITELKKVAREILGRV